MGEASQTQTAIVGNHEGGLVLSHEAPFPELTDDIVLVRNKAVSVNPVDTKMVGPYVTPGAIAGGDFAGIVEKVGPGAAEYNIKVGDRVSGAMLGMNPLEPTLGAFAQHVGAHSAGLLKVPEGVDFETAASMNMGFMTAGLGLFKSLDLPGYPLQPNPKPGSVLVYGGSTATGTAAIQLLKLAGYSVIATCSEHNFGLVKSYGADNVFDYRLPTCAADIKAHTKNNLLYALDCISTSQSMDLCYAALGRAGGRYTALEPFSEGIAATRKVVKPDWILGPVMLGRPIDWPAPHNRPAMPDMAEFGVKWRKTLQELYDKNVLRAHPLVIRSGSIEGIFAGMKDLKDGKLSGKKLIYPV
ncbi:zinc-binding dehydrogenase family oxidoreductase [Penicillium angulare]|uniref:Zinc-binding dehydrogenase family oxidoreductase n=1 Tax=Penicillium angulare TaxID=116970 RepID=A0A9W9GDB0_9EURO|nr:zinc-binding dehydrogenase family oxidoreductase [Penicillium angulare]